MAMTKRYLNGDRVEIIGGMYKPKRRGDRQFVKVVALAGKTKVSVALEVEGKPIKTLSLTSIAPIDDSREPQPMAFPTVTCHPRATERGTQRGPPKCSDCAECTHPKREVDVLAKALSAICSLRATGVH
jgi:hypothetical protein